MKCECPEYYTLKLGDGDVEVHTLIEAVIHQRKWYGIDAYDMGNVIKYLMRAGCKDSRINDLKKARNYLDTILVRLEADENAVL